MIVNVMVGDCECCLQVGMDDYLFKLIVCVMLYVLLQCWGGGNVVLFVWFFVELGQVWLMVNSSYVFLVEYGLVLQDDDS